MLPLYKHCMSDFNSWIMVSSCSLIFLFASYFFLVNQSLADYFKEQELVKENITPSKYWNFLGPLPFDFLTAFILSKLLVILIWLLLLHNSHGLRRITFWCFCCEFWIKTKGIFWLSRSRFKWRLNFSSEQFLKYKDKVIKLIVKEASVAAVILPSWRESNSNIAVLRVFWKIE